VDDSPIPRCKFKYISLALIICLLFSCGIFSFITNIDNSDAVFDGTTELILTFTNKHVNKIRSFSITQTSGANSFGCFCCAFSVLPKNPIKYEKSSNDYPGTYVSKYLNC